MKLLSRAALVLALLAPMPALADAHAAATVTIASVLPYASVGQSVFVTEGQDGAPEVIEVGMVLQLVDSRDPAVTFTGEVTGPVTDNGTPTGSWTVILTE